MRRLPCEDGGGLGLWVLGEGQALELVGEADLWKSLPLRALGRGSVARCMIFGWVWWDGGARELESAPVGFGLVAVGARRCGVGVGRGDAGRKGRGRIV